MDLIETIIVYRLIINFYLNLKELGSKLKAKCLKVIKYRTSFTDYRFKLNLRKFYKNKFNDENKEKSTS